MLTLVALKTTRSMARIKHKKRGIEFTVEAEMAAKMKLDRFIVLRYEFLDMEDVTPKEPEGVTKKQDNAKNINRGFSKRPKLAGGRHN